MTDIRLALFQMIDQSAGNDLAGDMLAFADISPGAAPPPDKPRAKPRPCFRHLLKTHGLLARICADVPAHLETRGLGFATFMSVFRSAPPAKGVVSTGHDDCRSTEGTRRPPIFTLVRVL